MKLCNGVHRISSNYFLEEELIFMLNCAKLNILDAGETVLGTKEEHRVFINEIILKNPLLENNHCGKTMVYDRDKKIIIGDACTGEELFILQVSPTGVSEP